ncbi:maestro heat-like repeat-containing protein family member 7 isoform X2 [Panthera leo]|uniref:maestro heat-like repeat-containing protein family member 7 isoform X2 n=1 Tax=Panthera leo TaxID=9689 RepID=UPI001C696576|nr:maestro heat-like repeat-containing protein family member 7 isoform X2 [Panthera leo]
MQMNPYPRKHQLGRVTFLRSTHQVSWNPDLTGLRQSEREACEFIDEFLEEGQLSESEKLKFLRAVETLSAAVQAQANGNMNDYFPKTILAKKIEVLILEESTEVLVSSVHQRAMLCIVALSQVNPPFYLSQKLDLVNAGISSIFSLPLIMPSLDRKESASLYLQTVQALDDMLQALVMEDMDPDMSLLQNFLEIILPWLTLSEKVHQQIRALGTISRMLRFICNFPRLSHMMEFSMTGKMMGILGLSCMNANHEISVEASEALHYFFKILVLHRSMKQKTEIILKDLQKNFRGGWFANIQNLAMFFRKYLTPEERADVIMVPMEALTNASRHDVCAASKMLKMILKHPMPEIGKVPEIIQYIYHNMNRITETTAQETIKKILYLLAQTYTEEVILTLLNMEDGSQRGVCKPWEILASFPKGYEVIMEFLLQKLTPYQKSKGQEPSHSTEISPLIATRAIQELLLEPSRRTEVQTFFPSLCMALLFQISFLVVEGDTDFQDQQHATERMDPVSSSVEALKTLMQSTGYGDYVSYIQKLGGWELLTSPERHYEGVTLLARAMVIKNCWHNRPLFSFLIRILQERDHKNRLTAFMFLTELLRCPDVVATVDEVTVRILANWFQCEEPAIVKLLLRVVETFAKHGNMVRQFRILEPYVLGCCYSLDDDIVMETFTVLKCLVEHLTWKHSSSFLTQLTFMLGPLFEEESEHLRLMAFEIYGALLAKVKRTVLVFPLKHQVLNLIVLLVLHLEDANVNVAQLCRPALCHTATILGWSRLKAIFAEKDVWTILRALLKQEGNRALWFLKQCLALFKSPQAPIRQTAVRFAGQIIQTLDAEEANEIAEVYTALKYLREDPDSMVSCLAAQTLYILEAKEKLLVNPPTSCFCSRRPRKTYS